MTAKILSIKSIIPIMMDGILSLNAVNELRLKYGVTRNKKLPISLNNLIETTKILEPRSKDHGQISFNIRYASCVRKFPNFGLDITSDSNIYIVEKDFAINIDLTVKAGKQKWQINEIQECSDIFKRKDVRIEFEYTCDEKTEWFGHSTSLNIRNERNDISGESTIPMSSLEVSFE